MHHGKFSRGTRRLPCYFWWQPSVLQLWGCCISASPQITGAGVVLEAASRRAKKGILWGLWLCLFLARAALLSCGSSTLAAHGATWSFLKHWIRISRNRTQDAHFKLSIPELKVIKSKKLHLNFWKIFHHFYLRFCFSFILSSFFLENMLDLHSRRNDETQRFPEEANLEPSVWSSCGSHSHWR